MINLSKSSTLHCHFVADQQYSLLNYCEGRLRGIVFTPFHTEPENIHGLSLLILVLGFHKGNEITEHDPFMAYLWLLDVIFGAFFF